MGISNYVHLEDCTIVAATEKAVRIAWDDSDEWFPRSQIADQGENLKVGESGYTVSISEWIAKQKGIDT
jgi:hypothetical protein